MLYIFLSIITHPKAIPSDSHYAKIGHGMIPGLGRGMAQTLFFPMFLAAPSKDRKFFVTLIISR